MSWKGFTKAVNRAGTSILQSAGAIERTIDRDFDEEERRYRSLETKMERLHREAKGYLDALRAMSLSQTRMASTIENFYDSFTPLSGCATEFRKLIEGLEEQMRAEIDDPYQKTVILPLDRFCQFFPDYNEALKKRSHKLLDYDAIRSKHRKLVDRPADDPSRLNKMDEELQEAKRLFEALNTPLKEELPKLTALRTTYLEPTFEAILKLQYLYAQMAQSRLIQLQASLNTAGYATPANLHDLDRELEGAAENALASMRELSICNMVQ